RRPSRARLPARETTTHLVTNHPGQDFRSSELCQLPHPALVIILAPINIYLRGGESVEKFPRSSGLNVPGAGEFKIGCPAGCWKLRYRHSRAQRSTKPDLVQLGVFVP